MDNGTMLETFKYLDYSQLAKNSLVSKRFSNLIRVHRHSLALLYVDHMSMERVGENSFQFTVFNSWSVDSEVYNEWVIRNNYSKQIPLKYQDVGNQSTQFGGKVGLWANAFYKDRNCRREHSEVFFATTDFSHENWPSVQHFMRLITDPFIYIRCVYLIPQNIVCNLLAAAFNSDRNRLQCEVLKFNLDGNVQKFINWTKNNVLCSELQIGQTSHMDTHEMPEEVVIDLFINGARCTSKIKVKYYEPSKVIIGFVQKFMDLKSSDEYQIVESIECYGADGAVKKLKRECAKFIVKEEEDRRTFEFINNDIGKKNPVSKKDRERKHHRKMQSCFQIVFELAPTYVPLALRLTYHQVASSKFLLLLKDLVQSFICFEQMCSDNCHFILLPATMDNGTMMEAFKYLNYCQLAKISLVSKRFNKLIRTHRHSLPLLFVDRINMKRYDRVTTSVSIFNEQLSLEEYNKWVIRNNYSKQVPQECQDAGTESTNFLANFLDLELTQFITHFARLLIDPFIFIRCLELTPQTAVLNLLAGAVNPDFNRLQCNVLVVNLEDNMQKLMRWIKECVLCKEFRIYDPSMNNGRHDEALLELFMTGAECTSEINIRNYDVSKVVFDLVKKFLDIKNCDEFNVVQSIKRNAAERKAVEEFKRKHAKFIVKEENENDISMHTFEFINNDVGKKLQLIITSLSHRNPYFSLNIDNL